MKKLFIETFLVLNLMFAISGHALADSRVPLTQDAAEALFSSRPLCMTSLGALSTENKYVLQNVATGLLLHNGANWGTQLIVENLGFSVMFQQYGLDRYRLYTGLGDGFIDINGYADGAMENYTDFLVEQISDSIFGIQAINNMYLKVDKATNTVYFNGNDTSDKYAQWRILDEEVLYYSRLTELPLTMETSPADVTFLIPWARIENARVPGRDNWTITSNGAQIKYGIWQMDAVPLMEFWYPYATNDASEISQNIWLHKGKYKLEVQGFYRDGDPEEAAYAHASGQEELHAFLFAGSERKPLKSIFDYTSTSQGPAWTVSTSLGWVPNDYTSASYAFKQEYYNNELTFTVEQDGMVPIGISLTPIGKNNSWCPFANFRLTYYGLTKIEETTYYIKNVGSGTYLSGGGAWGTQAIMSDCGLDFQVVKLSDGNYILNSGYWTDTTTEPVGALSSIGYLDRTDNTTMEIRNISGGIFSIKGDNGMYLTAGNSTCAADFSAGSSVGKYAQWQFVPESVVKTERAKAIPTASLESPIDVSYLVPGRNQNRNDSRIFDNWKLFVDDDMDYNEFWWNSGTGVASGSVSPDDNSISEFYRRQWNGSYMFTPESIFLPKGSYTLKIQGFYRDGDLIGSAQRHIDGQEKQDAVLFVLQDGQEISTPFMSIFDEARPTSQKGWSTYSLAGGFVPNTMEDASWAIKDGAYDNQLDFTVRNQYGEYVNIGAFCEMGTYPNNWLTFDNVRLYYYGSEIRETPTHIVTYLVDGDVYETLQVREGDAIPSVVPPEKEGYTFQGWEGLPATMGAADISVSARFEVNIYYVNYYVGAELWMSDPLPFGAPLVLRTDYVYPNSRYTFAGWIGETYETMPAHDVSYIASIVDGISGLTTSKEELVDVYSVDGRLILESVPTILLPSRLKPGLYIWNGKPHVVQ